MKESRGVRALWWTALLAGVAVALLSTTLILDGLLEKVRLAEEKEVVEALELRVPTEAAVAEELAAVLEIHTQRSVARDQRNRRLGWVLLVSSIIFVASAKSYQATRGVQRPSLITIGSRVGGEAVASLASKTAVATAIPGETAIDLDLVERVIRSTGRSRESAIPILQALQNHFRYLPEAALQRVCEQTDIAPSQIVGVASFYSQFRRDPVGRHLVRVCHGTACHVAGIGPIMDELRRQLAIEPDADTDPDRRFTLESVNCLGCCSLAPVMMVEEHVAGHLTPTSAWQELEAAEIGS